MDPFMNQGDQLDQGGKVEVEIFWWNFVSRKARPNKTRCMPNQMSSIDKKIFWTLLIAHYLRTDCIFCPFYFKMFHCAEIHFFCFKHTDEWIASNGSKLVYQKWILC